jgi:hypothetical protein
MSPRCIYCGGELSRVVPSVLVLKTIREYMPESMAVLCLKCRRQFLVLRNYPHGVIGTVRSKSLSNGNLHQIIFIADGGELIVSDGEEI